MDWHAAPLAPIGLRSPAKLWSFEHGIISQLQTYTLRYHHEHCLTVAEVASESTAFAPLLGQLSYDSHAVLPGREVAKGVKMRRVRTVIVAPNIEQIETEGGLDDLLASILMQAEAAGIPVVFALSRKKLGQVQTCTFCMTVLIVDSVKTAACLPAPLEARCVCIRSSAMVTHRASVKHNGCLGKACRLPWLHAASPAPLHLTCMPSC